jgi:hypothetical protein
VGFQQCTGLDKMPLRHRPRTGITPPQFSLTKLNPAQQKYVEGYAAALQGIQFRLTNSNWCAKSYDPMTCDTAVMHSYAFDMKDGGRHHPVEDYQDLEDIKSTLLQETVNAIHSHHLLRNRNNCQSHHHRDRAKYLHERIA